MCHVSRGKGRACIMASVGVRVRARVRVQTSSWDNADVALNFDCPCGTHIPVYPASNVFCCSVRVYIV